MVTKEQGNEIENLVRSGKSYREVSSLTGLSKSQIARYMSGEITIAVGDNRDIFESTVPVLSQNCPKLSQDTISKREFEEFKDEVKNHINNILQEYTPNITKEDIVEFKNELLKENPRLKGEVLRLKGMVNFQKKFLKLKFPDYDETVKSLFDELGKNSSIKE
jgi:transcriptional regulator with XRE-family HTH domain